MKQYWYDHHSNLILDTAWPVEKQIQSLADFVTNLDRQNIVLRGAVSDLQTKQNEKEGK